MEITNNTKKKKNILIPILSIFLLVSVIINGFTIYHMVGYKKQQKKSQEIENGTKRGFIFNLADYKAIERDKKIYIPIDALNKVYVYETRPYGAYDFWRYKEEDEKKGIIKKPVEALFTETSDSALIFYQGKQFLIPIKYVLVEKSQQFLEENALYEIFYKMYLVPEDKSKPIIIDPATFKIRTVDKSSEK